MTEIKVAAPQLRYAPKVVRNEDGIHREDGTGMDAVYFTIVAIGLYFLADAVLDRIEQRRGERFEHRSLIFFGILLALALVSFAAIRALTGT